MRGFGFRVIVLMDGAVHEVTAHLAVGPPLKWLGQDIGPHLLGPAMLNFKFPTINLVLYKEVPVVDVLGPLRAGSPAILR